MEVVILSVIGFVLFLTLTIVLFVQYNRLSKISPHKKTYKTWSIVSASLTGVALIFIFLGIHQHQHIKKTRGK
jgi:H+/gluconate symporter-like permease